MMTAELERTFGAVIDALEVAEMSRNGLRPRVERIQWLSRPFSDLLLVRLHEDDQAVRAYIKVLRVKAGNAAHAETIRARVRNDVETAAQVHRMFSGRPEFMAVRPLACFPDYCASVTEALDAEPLQVRLEREAVWFPSHQRLKGLSVVMTGVGRWVREFQTLTPPGGSVSLDGLRSYLDVRLQRLANHPAGLLSQTDRTRVLHYFDERSREIHGDDLREVRIHADYCPSNVLVSADHRVATIDFAMVRPGTMYNDLARMYTQLEHCLAKPHFRTATIRTLQRALLAGFDARLTEDHPLFDLMVLQYRINHMAALTRKETGLLAGIYNAHVLRRGRRWMRAKVRRCAGAELPVGPAAHAPGSAQR